MNQNRLPSFYLYLYEKIKEHFGTRTIKRKEVKIFLRGWNIPKNLREAVLKEMEYLGLVKLSSKIYMNITDPVIELNKINNPVNDTSRLNKMLGIW